MIVSVNWLKKYVDIDVSVEELAKLIGAELKVESRLNHGSTFSLTLPVSKSYTRE